MTFLKLKMKFWDKNTEKNFFIEQLKNGVPPEHLFYHLKEGYFAYVPKEKSTEGQTLQSRNSLIGKYTEKWCQHFFKPIAKKFKLFAINNVVCPELGLTKKSPADLAFCITNEKNQKPENIKLIFEIKMSILNNYKLENNKVVFIGNHTTHKGNPSLLRSDSMLKAIGKAINIRVSGKGSSKIPILIVGNSPITKSYENKVDLLKQSGIIQGFFSLYPDSAENYIKETKQKGFQTFNDYNKLSEFISSIIKSDLNFFSSMLSMKKLGQIIKISSQEKSDVLKAEKFLKLIQS